MKALKVSDILKATGGRLLSSGGNEEIYSISTDSRKIEKGCLFVPLVGENFDGHNFLESAVSAGAVAVLTQRNELVPNAEDVCVIDVDNTMTALGAIAALYRSMFKIPAIGITGSVGKTTTKEMCAEVISRKYNVHKNAGNFNNEIGVPLTIFGLDDSHDILISEMGMSGFGEIDRISKMVKPEIVIMTNIGMSHIELLGSQENIYKAKSEFIKNMNPEGTVIINGDDKILISHKDELGKHVITVGISNKDCDLVAENIKSDSEGVSFTVSGMDEHFNVKLSIPGEHNVYNALSACAVGMLCRIKNSDMASALLGFTPDSMRMCVIESNDFTVINDCYNAAPDSVEAALKVLSGYEGRKVAVLGDIACLGQYSYGAHKNLGAAVCKNEIDVLITIGEQARLIGEGAFENGMDSAKIFSFDNVEEALNKIHSIIRTKDTILVKASRVMKLERVTEFLTK